MNSIELDELSEKILSGILQKAMCEKVLSDFGKLIPAEFVEKFADHIAGMVVEKLEKSGAFEVSEVDMETIASVVKNVNKTIQSNDIPEKNIDLD